MDNRRHVGAVSEPLQFQLNQGAVMNITRTVGRPVGLRPTSASPGARGQNPIRIVLVDDHAVASASVRPAAEASDLRAELQRVVDALDPDQREAFLLKHVEQLSYDEMAAATGVGVSALKMRVKRACDRMQWMLREGEASDVGT